MQSALLLLTSVATLVAATPRASKSDNGSSWTVEVVSGSAASGYRWNDIYATYSGAPDKQKHCYWLYNPIKDSSETNCDQPDFYAYLEWKEDSQVVTIKQTAGTSILGGSGAVEMACGLGGSGRRCEGSVVITAGVEA